MHAESFHWPWLGHAIEVASVLLFGWSWAQSRLHRPGEPVELLVAVLYGWVLETLDMLVFGTYHYGPLTWWWVGDVPVYIPLLWAIIVHSSMALSDRLGLAEWARPFSDGLFAVLIDLAIDAIAIRAGLWSWGIPLNEGWFGVPAGNLYAWMWVAAWYSGVTRLVRARIERRGEPGWHRWLVPPVAYTGLLACLIGAGALCLALGWISQAQRMLLFYAHVAAFAAVVAAGFRSLQLRRRDPIPVSFIVNRWLMHASFFIILVATGIAAHQPWLVLVSLASMAVEGAIHRFSVRRT